MDILVTLDQNYLPQLKVLLASIHINHPEQDFRVYLLHSEIPDEDLIKLSEDLTKINVKLEVIQVPKESFANAPVTDRYPQEMYYRLLASEWLPQDLDKILYLDPDILVINPLNDLWDLNIDDYLFAAASHTGKTEIANNVNRIRLGTDSDYYNSGVLLINLKRCREELSPDMIFNYVRENGKDLILPDQDVLNALFEEDILEIDDAQWNYDARNYSSYLLRSGGLQKMDWIMENTAVLHFCGRDKPWRKAYARRFGVLYKHYMALTKRYLK